MQTKNVRVGKEIIVAVPDEVGVLSRISTIITGSHVSIIAICAYVTDEVAHLRLITDDNQRAIDALYKAGFDAVENEVTLAEVSPHSIHPEIAPFADNIQPGDHYWCAASHSGEHAILVYSLKDNVNMASIR